MVVLGLNVSNLIGEIMGQYYYINQTKKQFFNVGLFGQSSDFESIGRELGARAFGLLCS